MYIVVNYFPAPSRLTLTSDILITVIDICNIRITAKSNLVLTWWSAF